jgi:uncharacterized membrane protein
VSNDVFVELPALPLFLALALLILALARGVLAPGAVFNSVVGLALAVLMAKVLSEEGHEAFDGRLLAEIAVFVVELVIALTSLFFFVSRTRTLAIAVRIGLAVHVLLAAAVLAFAILFANANFAWH